MKSEGSEHGQKCIESKKNNNLQYKKPAATPTFCKQNFSSCNFTVILETSSQKPRLEKKSYLGYGTSEKNFACRKLG